MLDPLIEAASLRGGSGSQPVRHQKALASAYGKAFGKAFVTLYSLLPFLISAPGTFGPATSLKRCDLMDASP